MKLERFKVYDVTEIAKLVSPSSYDVYTKILIEKEDSNHYIDSVDASVFWIYRIRKGYTYVQFYHLEEFIENENQSVIETNDIVYSDISNDILDSIVEILKLDVDRGLLYWSIENKSYEIESNFEEVVKIGMTDEMKDKLELMTNEKHFY